MARTELQRKIIPQGKIGGYVRKINELRRALASAPKAERAYVRERLDSTLRTIEVLGRKRAAQLRARDNLRVRGVLPKKSGPIPAPQEP